MGQRLSPISALAFALFISFLDLAPAVSISAPPVAIHTTVSGPIQIDGVPVSGNTDAVSIADIRDAINAFKYVDSEGPASLSVIDKDEMHAYSHQRYLGWFTVGRTYAVKSDGSLRPGPWDAYGQWLPDLAGALHCIISAKTVYIFPVTTPLKPHRDNKHLRLLDVSARSHLVSLLGQKEDWFDGLNDLMYPNKEPTSIGFVFRNGSNELVLYFVHSDVVVGNYNGENVSATLDDLENRKLAQSWEAWKDQYAQPELKGSE